MTIDEVIEALERTPRIWKVTLSGRIRLTNLFGIVSCPITAACGYTGVWPYGEDLTESDISRLVRASDGMQEFDCTLRRRILKACGL